MGKIYSIRIRLDKHQFEQIKQDAEDEGCCSVSEYVRDKLDIE